MSKNLASGFMGCLMALAINNLAEAVSDNRVTFKADYDQGEVNASVALSSDKAGGYGIKLKGPSENQSAYVTTLGAHLHYLGQSNISMFKGTLQIRFKLEQLLDSQWHWLVEAAGDSSIGIQLTQNQVALVTQNNTDSSSDADRLSLSVPLHPDQWYQVSISWNQQTGQAWLSVDDQQLSATMPFSHPFKQAQLIYVAGGRDAKYGQGLMPKGLLIDDLVIYNVDLPNIENPQFKGETPPALTAARQSAQQLFTQVVDLQKNGGWMNRYTWPTLQGAFAQGRRNIGTEHDIANDKGAGTAQTAANVMYAAQVLNNSHFYDSALKAAELLLAAQHPNGYWYPQYSMTPQGVAPYQGRQPVKLQDQVQSHPILFLAYMHRVTGDPRYLQAAIKGGEFLLSAQNKNGSWSHHYNVTTGIGETRNKQPGGGELNDDAINDSIDIMILMAHLTKDAAYVNALRKAGQWLIDSQVQASMVGWAEQYDQNNKPVWARNFEPPAWSVKASSSAIRALAELYKLFNDERYLKPIQQYAKFVKQQFSGEPLYAYYDFKSKRALAAWDYKTYYLDSAKSLALYKTFPAGNGYAQLRPIRVDPDKLLADTLHPPKPKSIQQLLRLAQQAMQTQHQSGWWIEPVVANYQASLGQGFSVRSSPAMHILNYIQAQQHLQGELTTSIPTGSSLKDLAYPNDDWYQLGNIVDAK